MLRKVQERRSELFFMAASFILLGSVSVQGLFFEGERLGKLAQERAAEVERLKALDIMLSAEIGALQAEINALKTDSEETSLVARTLLGMVANDEVIYQLNQHIIEE